MKNAKLKIKKNAMKNHKFNLHMNLKTTTKKLFLFVALSLAITFNGCKKDNDIMPQPVFPYYDTIEVTDYKKALSIISEILNIKCKLQDLSPSDFFEISSSSSGGGINNDSCIQKELTNGDTIKLFIDYNENAGKVNSRSLIYCFSGIADANGIVREGQITYRINSEKFFLDSGMTCDIIIDNFKINGNKMNGIITIENKGSESYSISTQNFKVTIAGKTVEIVEGLFTKIDGEYCSYELSGHASLISSFGIAFTATITDTVIVETGCRWKLVAGIVEIDIPNQTKKSIDFGNGGCDPFAIITIDKLKIPIIL